ncbi:MAG: ABC transporter substrate-binding protein [Proteobacteria bacterium]|nr:ABC transporter substrate-binding protein [Pseudomonadota bacterium]MBI3495867.1 ABC transporter substrate-binding protein [Pseudomonadota bacterium]
MLSMMVGRRIAAGLAFAGLAGLAGLMGSSWTALGATTLKVVAEAEMRSVDPIWTTAGVVYAHGMMIYDMLYGEDELGVPHPQMVESQTASADGLTWTFTLRPGLKWQDGTPVTARDVVPSIRRWAARMAVGAVMMDRTAEMKALDDRRWEIRFKDRFGPVTNVLANSGTPLFVMREKDALTDPFQQVLETVGSGPFIFNKDEWVPGSTWTYRRNPDYLARSGPPAGHSGSKATKLDRVEYTYLPDQAVAVQSVIRGEMDIVQFPPTDLVKLLKNSPNVKVEITNKLGRLGILRPNFLAAPMDNPKIRQVLLYAMDQSQMLNAVVGNPEQEIVCWSGLACRVPLDTKVGLGDFAQPTANKEKARALLKESGYKNETIVLMNPTDQPQITIFAQLAAQQLKEVGFNIDMQSMDWATLVSRRSVKDNPSANRSGWHVFITTSTTGFQGEPLANNALNTTCDGKNWFGWPCDEELNKIRLEFVTAGTSEQRLEIAGRLNKRFYEVVPYVNTGQFVTPAAYRTNISGIIDLGYQVLWAVEKK